MVGKMTIKEMLVNKKNRYKNRRGKTVFRNSTDMDIFSSKIHRPLQTNLDPSSNFTNSIMCSRIFSSSLSEAPYKDRVRSENQVSTNKLM